MAKFVKGNGLNAEIESIFDDAEVQLTIISPFIKLHKRFKDSLKSKINNPKLEVQLVGSTNFSKVDHHPRTKGNYDFWVSLH